MKKIKKAYYYFFYKIYKSIEYTSENYGNFLTDFKASIVMMALEIWFLLSMGNYYSFLAKKTVEITIQKPIILIPFGIIIMLHYLAFIHTDTWRRYNKEFDKLPKKINRNGSWIVFGIVLFIIANFIFSFYLISQID